MCFSTIKIQKKVKELSKKDHPNINHETAEVAFLKEDFRAKIVARDIHID